MIYLLFGQDTYRSWEKLQQIKGKYLNASMGDTDLAILEGGELTADEFRRQVQTLPFLATSRLVIVKNLLLNGKKEAQEGVAEALSTIPQSTVVFFYEAGQPDKRGKLYKVLNKPKQAQEFPLLDAAKLQAYAKQRAKELELSLEPKLIERLAAITGPDLWRLNQELEKLALYTRSSKKALTETEFNQLIVGSPEAKIFDLTDAFGMRQSAQALQLLDRLDPEESDLGLLAMIAGHYRNLVAIADGRARSVPRPQLSQQLQLHPFVFGKCYDQAGRYSYEELISIYRFLFQLDLLAKQSIFEPRVGLTVLAKNLDQKPIQLPELTEESML